MSICTVEWCTSLVKAQGLCSRHYERFRTGRELEGERTRRKRGTGGLTSAGYIVYTGKLVHRTIAEKALGRALKGQECIHHVDELHSNNTNTNLVICPNHAYHALLHKRMKALVACGNANWRKCQYCGRYSATDDPDLWATVGYAQHRSCAREHIKKYREAHR